MTTRVLAALSGVMAVCLAVAGAGQAAARIDRHALVTRPNPHLTGVDPWAPLSVGNGRFAMTVEIHDPATSMNPTYELSYWVRGLTIAYTPSGHCPQGADGQLPVYLPANGALLAAVAMMAGGWDGAPPGHAPGFPRDGSWVVRSEGFRRLP